MSMKEIESKVRELQELKRMREELDAEIEVLEGQIKGYMTENDMEQMIAGAFKVSFKEIVSSRFDSTKFKKDRPDLAEQYMKVTSYRRFTVV